MKSKISSTPPTRCEDCEFYQASSSLKGQADGLCLWTTIPVHRLNFICQLRELSPTDLLKRQLVIAAQNYVTPPRRRKSHGNSRQDHLL